MASTTLPVPSLHPFQPRDLALPGYVPNDLSAMSLVTLFGGACAAVATLVLRLVTWRDPALPARDRAVVVWFVISGSVHCVFEGYFVYNHARMPGRMDVLAQLWKEYALSDSRYVSSDPLLLCMEILSVFIFGPLCILTAWLIACGSGYRYSLQALVSTGHIYSNLLYFATSLYDDYFMGKKYYRPEPVYFWVYFVFMNAIWLVVPGLLLYDSMKKSAKAFIEVKGTRRIVKDLYNMMKDAPIRVGTKGTDKKEL